MHPKPRGSDPGGSNSGFETKLSSDLGRRTTRAARRALRHPVSPGCLGLVEGHISGTQQGLAGIAVGRKAGKSYRDGQLEHSVPCWYLRPLDGPAHGFRTRAQCRFSRSGKDNDEFLPAGPTSDIFLAHAGCQFLRDPPQGTVADFVAQRVVDPLEMIHVDRHDADRSSETTRAQDFAVQAFLELAAIVQAGERIAHRLQIQVQLAHHLPSEDAQYVELLRLQLSGNEIRSEERSVG